MTSKGYCYIDEAKDATSSKDAVDVAAAAAEINSTKSKVWQKVP